VDIGCGHIVESWRKALTTKLYFGVRDMESRDVTGEGERLGGRHMSEGGEGSKWRRKQ
jgi:hypothetical protein